MIAEILEIIIKNSIAWFLVIFIPGFIIQLFPVDSFSPDFWLFKIRRFEKNGLIYMKYFKVKKWKLLAPEGASAFKSGFKKKKLAIVDNSYLKIFIKETVRAEAVHWIILSLTPLFFIWNRLEIALWMIPFSLLINLPCIIIQRYNRPRLQKISSLRE